MLLLEVGAELKTCKALAAQGVTFLGHFHSLPTLLIRRCLMLNELSA